jgi:DNA-binding response OmpR family regulator
MVLGGAGTFTRISYSPEHPSKNSNNDHERGQREQHKRVMLVDDEWNITFALKRGIEAHQRGSLFQVDTFNDPVEALAYFKTKSNNRNYYDLIILDIRMPHMNGFQLARNIWKVQPDAKICFLTAYAIYEAEAIRVFPPYLKDYYCFIQKPIHLDDLINLIKQRLSLV